MSKTVFIIEDEIFLQGLEATRLKKEGYGVVTAANSEEVDKVLQSKVKIDIILLDLMLPGISGYTVLEKIKKIKEMEDVKVIVFSNLSEEKDIEKAKKIGINEFMVKSNFDLGQLSAKVKELIGV